MKNNFLGIKCLQLLMGFALLSGSTLSAAIPLKEITYGTQVHLNSLLGLWTLRSTVLGKTGTITNGETVRLVFSLDPMKPLPRVTMGNTLLGTTTFTIQTTDGINFALIPTNALNKQLNIVVQWPPNKGDPLRLWPSLIAIPSTGILYNFKKQ